MNPILDDDDYRRAGTLLRNLNPEQPDVDAANRVLREAHQAGRGTQLTTAVAALTYAIHPDLKTDQGQTLLGDIILDHYQKESPTDDNNE